MGTCHVVNDNDFGLEVVELDERTYKAPPMHDNDWHTHEWEEANCEQHIQGHAIDSLKKRVVHIKADKPLNQRDERSSWFGCL